MTGGPSNPIIVPLGNSGHPFSEVIVMSLFGTDLDDLPEDGEYDESLFEVE